jgi:hypothetical protein
MTIIEWLESLDACPEAVLWAQRFRKLEELWYECPQVEWMLWILEQIGYADQRKLRTFAAACARHYWGFLIDVRCQQAIDVADRFAKEVVSLDQLKAARQAAKAALDEIVHSPSWTASVAAASTAAYHTTRSSAMEAAKKTSSCCLRAAAWDQQLYVAKEDEEVRQLDQLRSLLGSDLQEMVAMASRRMRAL